MTYLHSLRSSKHPTSQGRVFVLEGIDGVGKTSQAKCLKAALEKEESASVLLVREPGGTVFSESVRELFLKSFSPRDQGSVLSQLCLVYAARFDLFIKKVKPHLDSGGTVIYDRFIWSTWAYQIVNAKEEEQSKAIELLRLLHEELMSLGFPAIDHVFVLDDLVESALFRKACQGEENHFESKLSLEIYRNMQNFYQQIHLLPLPNVVGHDLVKEYHFINVHKKTIEQVHTDLWQSYRSLQ